jgi:tRNA(fMet)-specific endonuclease VapC
MILLDTDHLSVLQVPSSERRTRLLARVTLAGDEVVGTTIVSVEEQTKGWLAAIARERQSRRQVRAYRGLSDLFGFFRPFHIAQFDEQAADLFDSFASLRVGTMDRKIAAITIVNHALLLSANRRDYEKIPGLRFENWMD